MYRTSVLDIANAIADFPVLETERLLLRRPNRADAEPMFAYMSDPAVVEYFGVPPMESLEQAIERLERLDASFAKQLGIRWALELRETGEFIGTAGPWRWMPDHFRVEIGYEMARPFWGQGFMQEALTAAIDFCFSHGVHSIEANIHPDNGPSQRLLERLGFQFEGRTRESFYEGHLGFFTDNSIFGLLAHEWRRDRLPEGI